MQYQNPKNPFIINFLALPFADMDLPRSTQARFPPCQVPGGGIGRKPPQIGHFEKPIIESAGATLWGLYLPALPQLGFLDHRLWGSVAGPLSEGPALQRRGLEDRSDWPLLLCRPTPPSFSRNTE